MIGVCVMGLGDSLIFVVVGWYALGIPTGKPRGEVRWAKITKSTIGVFPVQIFAYTCAQNVSFASETLAICKLNVGFDLAVRHLQ